jgi:hypothetical protein
MLKLRIHFRLVLIVYTKCIDSPPYTHVGTIVRPSCFTPKERSALKKCRPRYISALKKSRPRYISAQKNLLCNRINWENKLTKWLLMWIRHSLQASIASTHRHVHVQIVVLGSFLHYSWLFFLCSSIRLTQLILLQRRFFGPRYIEDDFFLKAEIYRCDARL